MEVIDDSSVPHVKLIIGLLLYFNQIGQVKYDPATGRIRLVLFIKKIADTEFARLQKLIYTHLRVHDLIASTNSATGIELVHHGPVDQIVIERALDPFLRKDLTIVVELINQALPAGTIIENEILDLPQLIYPDELDDLITDALTDSAPQGLTGFWHHGRLTVYPMTLSEQ
ncbi:MAG TPA: hypothetical protein GX739_06550 [Firmicutes bacterium]|nr:hypothetical protein [Bacillota bacterium]